MKLSAQALSVLAQMFSATSTQMITVPLGQLDAARAVVEEIRAWVQAAQADIETTPER